MGWFLYDIGLRHERVKLPQVEFIVNFTAFSSFLDVKKQRPKINLEKSYQCSVRIDISLDLKVYFSLVTY